MTTDRLQFTTMVLENGLTLHQHAMDVPFMQLSIVVPVGAAHMTLPSGVSHQGITHLLEHMCMKRSARHPNQDEFEGLLAAVGGKWNAWTTPYYTEFYISLPQTLAYDDYLAGFFSHVFEPVFDEGDLEKEKTIILNEANLDVFYPGTNSAGQYRFTKWMDIQIYEKAQLFGTESSLSAITTDDLHAFHQHYTIPGIQLFLGGAVDATAVTEYVTDLICTGPTPTLSRQPAGWANRDYHVAPDANIASPVLSWGGVTAELTLEQYLGIRMMGFLLTDFQFGILSRWLRHEKGWTYGVDSHHGTARDRSEWIIDIPLETMEQVDEVRADLHDRVVNSLRSESFLMEAKQSVLARDCYNYQTLSDRLDDAIFFSDIFGSIPTEADLTAWVTALTTADLMSIYEEFFAPVVSSMLTLVPEGSYPQSV